MTTTKKTCFKCGKTLPLEEFYRHKMMADGHLNKCKKCTKADVFVHRQNNLEKIRAYDRARGSRQTFEYTQKYRLSNPDRYHAHTLVNSALRLGKLKKLPCFICGCEKTQAHHPDYSSPLDVVWLCGPHHAQAHANTKRIMEVA